MRSLKTRDLHELIVDWGSRIKKWKNVQNSAIDHHTKLIINRKRNNLNKHYFLNSASLLSFEGNICGEMYCLNIHAFHCFSQFFAELILTIMKLSNSLLLCQK